MTSVDITYQIVSIKLTNSDWVAPFSTDHIHITGPIPKDNIDMSDNEAPSEDENFEIPCAAYLVWGDRSIKLTCLYYPSFSLFTDFRECEDGEGIVGAMTEDQDMEDDNGTPFLVLHAKAGLCGPARLYGKRVVHRREEILPT